MNFAAPFHQPCLQMFRQALRYLRTGQVAGVANIDVSKELLLASMEKCHDEKKYQNCLQLDYGELNAAAREQYWYCERGYEVPQLPGLRLLLTVLLGLAIQSLSKSPNISVLEQPPRDIVIEQFRGHKVACIPPHSF